MKKVNTIAFGPFKWIIQFFAILLLPSPLLPLWAQSGHKQAIERILISPQGNRLFSISKNQIRVWSIPGLRFLQEYEYLEQFGLSNYEIGFSPAGDKLVLSKKKAYYGKVEVYSLANAGALVKEASFDGYNAQFSLDGHSIIFLQSDGKKAKLVKANLGSSSTPGLIENIKMDHQKSCFLREIKPDVYVYNFQDKELRFQKGTEKKPHFTISSKWFPHISFSSKNDYLLFGSQAYDLRGDTPVMLAQLNRDRRPIGNKPLIQNGIVIDENGYFQVIDAVSGDDIKVKKRKNMNDYSSLEAISLDGNWVALINKNKYDGKMVHVDTDVALPLSSSPIEWVKNFAKLQMADSVLAVLEYCLKQPQKPNMAIFDKDTLFAFVAQHPKWVQLTKGDWYSPSEKLVMEANEKQKAGEFESALVLFSKAAETDPKNVFAFEGKATNLMVLKKPDEAGKNAKTCLQLDSMNTTCMLIMGEYFEKAGKRDNAASYYRKVAKLDHSRLNLSIKIARMYHNKDHQKVISELSGYVRDFPDNVEALRLIGNAYRLTLQYETAARHFENLASLTKSDDDYALAADCWYSAKDWERSKSVVTSWGYQREGTKSALLERYKLKMAKPPRDIDFSDAGRTDLEEGPSRQNTGEGGNRQSFSGANACTACKGTGKSELQCNSCYGKGTKTCTTCHGQRFTYGMRGQGSYCGSCSGQGKVDCFSCGGRGSSPFRPPCMKCGGSGKK